MRRLISFVPLLLVAFLICLPTPPAAAKIVLSNAKDCALELDGEILAGDFDRLQEAAMRTGLLGEVVSGEATNAEERALCLNSLGGNYVEGRKIAGLVHKFGITTRVKDRAQCYSACALIFMAGHSLGAEVDGPSRYLHVAGRLGFHAPYFTFDASQKFTGEEASALVELNNKIISEFIRFGSYASVFDAKPMFSLSLLGEMLAAGPNDLAEISTIEQVARWGIFLEGERSKARLDNVRASQACLNFQAWSLDRPSDVSAIDYYKTQEPEIQLGSLDGKEVRWAKIFTGGMEDRHCLVSLPEGEVSAIAICSRDEFNGLIFGDCADGIVFWVPWYYALPPNTAISTLASN